MIESRLSVTALTVQDVHALFRNEEWIALEIRNAKLVFLKEFVETECGAAVNIASLADLFKLTRYRVHTVRVKTENKSRVPHRPLVLSNEQESELCLMMREKVLASNYVTKMEFLNSVKKHFRVNLIYGWIRYFLQRRSKLVQKRSSHRVNCRDCKFCVNIRISTSN
jgi:hypothetical protein